MTTTEMSFAEKMRTTSDEKRAEIEAIISEKVASRQAKQDERVAEVRNEPVSYTHLTLPTILLV